MTQIQEETFDFDHFKIEAIQRLQNGGEISGKDGILTPLIKRVSEARSGKSLFGKDGAFAPMLKQFLEAAMESEMEEHLQVNKRNGKSKKTIKSSIGVFETDTPQGGQSNFAPKIFKK